MTDTAIYDAMHNIGYDWLRHRSSSAFSPATLGDSGDAAGPEPRLLFHVARRAAAEDVLRHSSEVPHALALNLLFMVFVSLFSGFVPLSSWAT
jgi:hypothetical protein